MRLPNGLIVLLLVLTCCSPAWAVDKFQFDFYYQVIEEVVPPAGSVRDAISAGGAKAVLPAVLNNAKQKLPWGTADSPLPLDVVRKKVAKRLSKMTVGREVVTSYDKKNRYKVNRVKVTSEQHLLALMGAADGDESKLTNGQKALVEMYRFSLNQTLIGQMKKGFKEKINILVTDTNGNDSEAVKNDFWPCASGDTISFSSTFFERSDAKELARSVFIHEAAHTLDKTYPEYEQAYGPDGAHYANEMIKPKAAFMEGWAVFAQLFYSKDEEERVREAVKIIKIEGTEAGKYTEVKAEQLSGPQLLNVEGIAALIFLDLTRSLPNGADAVFDAFIATNQRDRTLSTVLRHLVEKFPAKAEEIARIVDQHTSGRLTSTEMKTILGDTTGVKTFLLTREAARFAAMTAASEAASLSSGKPMEMKSAVSAPVQTDGSATSVTLQGGNPYGDL